MRRSLLLVAAFTACSSRPIAPPAPATGEHVTETAPQPADAHTATAATAATSDAQPTPTQTAACPASYGASGACGDAAIGGPCTYPEGTCECMFPCPGGAAMPQTRTHVSAHWVCTPTPPAVRADGCPGKAPTPGTPCKGTRDCHYAVMGNGPCPGATYHCARGSWTYPVADPPPP